jgi:hypothetical protein
MPLCERRMAELAAGQVVLAVAMPETNRLWETVNSWWTEIEVLIDTGVTNTRTEARTRRSTSVLHTEHIPPPHPTDQVDRLRLPQPRAQPGPHPATQRWPPREAPTFY